MSKRGPPQWGQEGGCWAWVVIKCHLSFRETRGCEGGSTGSEGRMAHHTSPFSVGRPPRPSRTLPPCLSNRVCLTLGSKTIRNRRNAPRNYLRNQGVALLPFLRGKMA